LLCSESSLNSKHNFYFIVASDGTDTIAVYKACIQKMPQCHFSSNCITGRKYYSRKIRDIALRL